VHKTIVRFRYPFISTLFVIIFFTAGLVSNNPHVQARVEIPAQTSAPMNTMVPTVTGWPTQTPTFTPSPIIPGTPTPTDTPTSYPGPPVLIFPPDGALMPQPVAPEEWYFSWIADCGYCWSTISIKGPGGRAISEDTGSSHEYHYSTDTFLPDDALGPWTWTVGVCKQLGCNQSETRTFWVRSATVTPIPEFRRYLPGVVQGAPYSANGG